MPICSKCNSPIRFVHPPGFPAGGRNVCNCSKRPNGHALYPTCKLEPGSVWHDCDCIEIDHADRPCMSCEALAISAKSCDKCADLVIERAANFADYLAKSPAQRRKIRQALHAEAALAEAEAERRARTVGGGR